MFIRPPIARRFPPRGPPVRNNNQQPYPENSDDQQADEQFYPGVFDVLKVRHILLWKVRPEGLPVEVVDMIVDAAEYWPSAECTLEERMRVSTDIDRAVVCTSPFCYDENTLDTPSPKVLPHRTAHSCRKIMFTITSHDQGGYNESRLAGPDSPPVYGESYTWFDTEVIHNAQEPTQQEVIHTMMSPTELRKEHFPPTHPRLLPRGNALQRNRARRSRAKRHRIVWHHLDDIESDSPEAAELERDSGRGRETFNGKQVREMELGDSIVVWARARFAGWVNYVDEVSVRVFWAV
ncbi:uncharacterized protein BDV17DRAFT_265388 [Aspergillus undulatus]|uniref:uncharacterized protein n=1 Tax=Aspergillus undulatus TaxID=1810928 RepID=UPI003CCD24DE